MRFRPCVGCGYCCKKAKCTLGMSRSKLPNQQSCEFLTYHDSRHWCGLVEDADATHKPTLEDGLAIGAGCCSPLNSERRKYEDV